MFTISQKRERHFARAHRDGLTGCLIWDSTIGGSGYGIAKYNGKTIAAHRLSWIFEKGNIPDGMLVCHYCDNKLCINPAHLFLGTQKQNIADMFKKGRQAKGRYKLSEGAVRNIMAMYSLGTSQKELAKLFSITSGTISRVCNGKSWRVFQHDAVA